MNRIQVWGGVLLATMSVASLAGKHEPPPHKKVELAYFKCEASRTLEGGLYGGPFSYGEGTFKRFGPVKSACSSSEWVAIKPEEFKRLATVWYRYDWNKEGPWWNADRSLCNAQEKVVFSCFIKKRMVSLCATPDLTAKTGRLTYRFGLLGKTPELVYPATETQPKEAFTASFINWARRSYQAISFKLADRTYKVYNHNADIEGEPSRSNGAGVIVEKSGKVIADLWCDEPYQNKMWESLHEIGLPEPKP